MKVICGITGIFAALIYYNLIMLVAKQSIDHKLLIVSSKYLLAVCSCNPVNYSYYSLIIKYYI